MYRFSTQLSLSLCLLIAPQLLNATTIPWTPATNHATSRVEITVPLKYRSVNLVPSVNDVFLPTGWSAQVFYAGNSLGKPRFLAWGPDSVLFVANMGKNTILAMPDMDNDGVADTAIVATRVPSNTSSLCFYRDTMYVGSESGIRRYWRSQGTGLVFDKSQVVVDKSNSPAQLGGNHVTRTVVVDSVHNKLYVSIGSKGNADRESERALIEEYNLDGSNRHIYATGLRNAIGLTLHPRTGQLWSNNNGSDQQGNNIPPEWIDLVRADGFYGYPFAYHVNNWFDLSKNGYSDILPLTAADSARVATMVPPAALVEAHCAPMQLVFSSQHMPKGYRNGAFMAMRGSWNRQPVSGTKLVYLEFENDQDTIAKFVADFCTGFLPDSNNSGSRWARPVGVALSADGSIYLTSDDEKLFVLRLVPPATSDVNERTMDARTQLRVFPNPAQHVVHIQGDERDSSITVFSAIGEVVIPEVSVTKSASISLDAVPVGAYVVVSRSGERTPLMIVR